MAAVDDLLSVTEQLRARFEEFLRIDRFAVDARLVMQMRAGRAAGRADQPDDLADANLVADMDVDLRQMAVAGRQPVAMIDLHHIAVAAVPSGDGDAPDGRGMDRFAGLAADVHAGM